MALAVTTVLAQRAPPEREIESGWSFLLKRGETAWPSCWLGCATWSVLDSSKRTFETVRLAIAKGDRSARALHPSQVAGHDDPPYAGHGNEEGRCFCAEGASRVIDCEAIGGSVGENGPPRAGG